MEAVCKVRGETHEERASYEVFGRQEGVKWGLGSAIGVDDARVVRFLRKFNGV